MFSGCMYVTLHSPCSTYRGSGMYWWQLELPQRLLCGSTVTSTLNLLKAKLDSYPCPLVLLGITLEAIHT